MAQRLLAVLVALMLVVGVQAQSNPRLGTWRLNVGKSTYQHGPAPKSETRTYTAWEKDGVSTRVDTVGADGKTVVTSFSSHLDGKPYNYTSPVGDKIANKGTDWRTVDAVVSKAGKTMQTTHSAVSADGKTLTMTTTYPGDTKTDVRLYDKQ